MNIFETHSRIVSDYASYISSFIKIADPKIREVVEGELSQGKLWPEPLLQFNPAFEIVGGIDLLTESEGFHPDLRHIFSEYKLYRHQIEAMRLGAQGKDFVVTSGTGSGKSLTYIGSIFNHILSQPGTKGVTGVVVYPMNALINSQFEEFSRFQAKFKSSTGRDFPISFGQYTGQEKEEARIQDAGESTADSPHKLHDAGASSHAATRALDP
jgi:ATP-dependent helicase YprA (DUF1998 family)